LLCLFNGFRCLCRREHEGEQDRPTFRTVSYPLLLNLTNNKYKGCQIRTSTAIRGLKLEFRKGLIGRCGIYCGACRLLILKKCSGCSSLCADKESKCPYYKCVQEKGIDSCGECQEFPCERHYGPMGYTPNRFSTGKNEK
jgi:hypothetical protein